MRFCQPHWDSLKAAISERGLDSLIAKDGQQAFSQLLSQGLNGVRPENFDPLMAAHNAILGRVMSLTGMEVMLPNPDGSDRCPLCFAHQEHASHCNLPNCDLNISEDWIPSCADAMREEAIRLGLVGAS